MPSVKNTFPSEFVIIGDELKDGDKIVFVDGGKLEMSEKYGREQLIFRVKLPDGSEKNLSVNKTSANNLSEAYGDDTEGWEGKEAVAEITKQNIGGENKSVAYLSPIAKAKE